MDASIFRKSSLERISSPDQLNEYLKVTHPKVWVVLLGHFLILIALVIWVLWGTVPESVQMSGFAYSREGPANTVYGYLRLKTAKRLRPGMAAQVSPDYAPRNQFGYIHGKIVQIGEKPLSVDQLRQRFPAEAYLHELLPREGPAVEIVIQLESGPQGLHWSNKKGESLQITSGSECNLQIITQERRPFELVFNR